MIGEEIVGVSLVWRFEVMVDGHCWVSLVVVVHGWVKSEVVGHCLVMCGVVGHFVEVAVAVAVECWEEEEGLEEGVVVSYLVGVEGSEGVGG